jgi:hypothetical protein
VVTTGGGVDSIAFEPTTALAFASNGEGTVTVVHEDSAEKFTPVGDVPTRRGARTLALDGATQRIFLSTAQFGPPPSATAENRRPRPSILPGTFEVLVLER